MTFGDFRRLFPWVAFFREGLDESFWAIAMIYDDMIIQYIDVYCSIVVVIDN